MGPRLMNTTVVVALLAVIVLAAKDMAAAVRRLVMTTTAVEDMTLHPFEVFVDLLLMITLLLEVLIAKTPMLVHLQAAMTILILRATIAHPDRGAHPEVMAVMTRLRVVTGKLYIRSFSTWYSTNAYPTRQRFKYSAAKQIQVEDIG